jgi:hypothetical protein
MAGSTLIGTWDRYGDSVTHDEAAYLALRPLGNAPAQKDEEGAETQRAGQATGPLRYANYGVTQRKLSTLEGNAAFYPAGTQPLQVTIQRHEFEDGTFGYLAGVTGFETSRDPLVRRLGEYSDKECLNKVAETETFALYEPDAPEARAFGADEESDPLILTRSATGAGPVTQSADADAEYHVAVLAPSDIQEGFVTLPRGVNSVTRQFWTVNQPDV